jgi:ubiquinone/menaquinone biosynthesis C-methylase UbiE
MLPRILEPEVMDTPEEARDYDAMDHAEVNARFVADFLALHGACRGGWYLDVGTGTARIPIALAVADPSTRVIALDLAEHMLALARQNIIAAGLAERIVARNDDAKAIADSDARFEAVVSNSIVHHIPEPRTVLAEMVRLVEPGGTLFVRDLERPPSPQALEHLVETYAGQESDRARALFRNSLNAALTLPEIGSLIRELGLPDSCLARSSDRHWTLAWKSPASTS